MTTTAEFERWLREQIGYTESPSGSNRTKFAALAKHPNGWPWCATLLAAGARQLSLRLPSYSASTRTMAAAFQKTGRWGTEPRRGAFAFFAFEQHIDHVEWVVKPVADGDITIGGNTSPTTAGSQFNGGCVALKHRAADIVGYGYPEYTEAPLVTSTAPKPLKVVAVKAGSKEHDLMNLYPHLFGDRDLWLSNAKLKAADHVDTIGFGLEVDGGRWYVGKDRYETLRLALAGEKA